MTRLPRWLRSLAMLGCVAVALGSYAAPASATQQAWQTFKGCEFANDQISWSVPNQRFLLGVYVKSCASSVTKVQMAPQWQHRHFDGYGYSWWGPMGYQVGTAILGPVGYPAIPRGSDPPYYFPDTTPCGNTGNPSVEMFYGETAEVGMATIIEVTKSGSVFGAIIPYNVPGQYATCAL